MIFSWQTERWEQLDRLRKENRLPHALLFSGPAGIGKRELAKDFAQLLLCQTPGTAGESCHCCHACHLVESKGHPDFRLIEPEQEGQAIKIDQIRDLSEFIQKTSHQGGYRVVIIQPATAMNNYSANALLKTLEEPTPGVLIILITDNRSALPITIVSRCQQHRFSIPDRADALSWLRLQNKEIEWAPILEAAEGAPFKALQWHQEGIWSLSQNFFRDLYALSQQEVDPLQLAVQWKESNVLWLFDLFFQWLLRLMRAEQALDVPESSAYLLPGHISLLNLLEFSDYLQRLRAEALGPYNLNQQLLLESLFIRWAQYAAR